MVYETIDTHEAINGFHRLMDPNSEIRILRLVGDAKIGKSHLLVKVFPTLARQKYQARCTVLDLRNRADTISDILQMACSQIGPKGCGNYEAADQTLANQPKVRMEHIFLFFSYFHASVMNSLDDDRRRDRFLTTEFVKDISKLNDKLMLLLFDSVDSADKKMQEWLMDTLLIRLAQLDHIRLVIAGRSLPEANSSYKLLCGSYQLQPVTEEEEYITFCRSKNITLPEQSIRDIAYVLNHSPGLFAEYVLPKYLS